MLWNHRKQNQHRMSFNVTSIISSYCHCGDHVAPHVDALYHIVRCHCHRTVIWEYPQSSCGKKRGNGPVVCLCICACACMQTLPSWVSPTFSWAWHFSACSTIRFLNSLLGRTSNLWHSPHQECRPKWLILWKTSSHSRVHLGFKRPRAKAKRAPTADPEFNN